MDVNSKNGKGRSALHYAAHEGNVGVIKLLLANPQLDVNSIDKYGFTALHGALH